jgi:thiol-disulfide isomerase/thioredoxin
MLNRKPVVLSVSAVILIACAASWFFVYGRNTRSQSAHDAHSLRQAPEFALRDHSGVIHKLQEEHAKIVILHFWAAWCPPCLSEIPEIIDFAQHFQNDRLKVIAISLDEKWPDAEKVLESAKLPKDMISLLDEGSKTSDAYGTYQFPETYLINGNGEIVAKWVGAQPWSDPRLEAIIHQQISLIR